jgi:hypothetical protein
LFTGALSNGAELVGPGVIGPVLIGAAAVEAGKVWIGAAPAPCGTITVTPESWGTAWALRVPVLTAAPRLAVTRSLLDTRVLESTTGIEPRCTLAQPLSKASAVKAGIHHLFTSHPLA